MTMTKAPLGIYVHIPFCLKKCNYCDFCSLAGQSRADRAPYFEALCRQIAEFSLADGYSVDTVYFGGGTPSLPDCDEIAAVMSALREKFDISKDAEITFECNPATADEKKLTALRALGFNRISIGAQSMNDGELSALGRLHTAEEFIKTFLAARGAGFDNISVDVMYGIPQQTPESFGDTLDKIIALSPEHISAYCLKVEPNTPFGRARSLPLPDEDACLDMYSDCIKRLQRANIEQYEISNFARRGHKSRHNLKYWHCDDYIGFGAAAHSCFEGKRFAAPADISAYIGGQFTDAESILSLDRQDRETEFVMLSMRLCSGLDRSEYFSRFGTPPDDKYAPRFAPYIKQGLVSEDSVGWHFTQSGMFVSNYILSDILDLG